MLLMAKETEFTARLRAFRRSKDWTQAELAEKLELSRTTYTSYEQGLSAMPNRIQNKLIAMGFGHDAEGAQIPAAQLLVPVPYIGLVSAGSKFEWTTPAEAETFVDVPCQMGIGKGRFCCKAASDSCYDLIWPGDTLVFQEDPTPKLGVIVFYISPDRLSTIKQLKHNGSEFILHPLNNAYEDEPATGKQIGYLIGIIREQGSKVITVYDGKGIYP